MRIAINARSLATEQVRGWSRYTLNLCRALSHHDVDLFLFSDRKVNKKLLTGFNTDRVKVVTHKGYFYLDWEQNLLPALCEKYKVDILHCPTHYGLPAIAEIPKVITLHDSIERSYYRDKISFGKKLMPSYWYIGVLQWLSRRSANKIITVSQYSKKSLNQYYGISSDRMEVIYEAADPIFDMKNVKSLEDLSAQYELQKPYFFYVGGLEQRKNIECLLEGFKLLENEDGQLVIAGGSEDEVQKYLALATEMEIDSRVKFLGFVPDEDLPGLYHHAQAFVYPSFAEGFGLQVVEAMAMGCPVICSSDTSLPEILDSDNTAFDPYNPQKLAELMESMLTNTNFIQRQKDHIFHRSQQFSWEKCAERTLGVYRAALEEAKLIAEGKKKKAKPKKEKKKKEKKKKKENEVKAENLPENMPPPPVSPAIKNADYTPTEEMTQLKVKETIMAKNPLGKPQQNLNSGIPQEKLETGYIDVPDGLLDMDDPSSARMGEDEFTHTEAVTLVGEMPTTTKVKRPNLSKEELEEDLLDIDFDFGENTRIKSDD